MALVEKARERARELAGRVSQGAQTTHNWVVNTGLPALQRGLDHLEHFTEYAKQLRSYVVERTAYAPAGFLLHKHHLARESQLGLRSHESGAEIQLLQSLIAAEVLRQAHQPLLDQLMKELLTPQAGFQLDPIEQAIIQGGGAAAGDFIRRQAARYEETAAQEIIAHSPDLSARAQQELRAIHSPLQNFAREFVRITQDSGELTFAITASVIHSDRLLLDARRDNPALLPAGADDQVQTLVTKYRPLIEQARQGAQGTPMLPGSR